MKDLNATVGKKVILKAIVFASVMSTFMLSGLNSWADTVVPSEYRVSIAGDKFDETRQYAMAFKLRPPRRLRARHLELAVGVFSTPAETRPFVSIGPVWRLPITGHRWFVEAGFSPTLIAGSALNGRELGGNFHFTSSVSVGATFGAYDQWSTSLRVQHTSNGSLNKTNPGIDMIGLNFAFDFDLP